MSAQPFDWENPDYEAIYAERAARLQRIRANPESLPALKNFYAENPAAFIDDWGLTADPRNHGRGIPIEVPFKLFPKQRELIEFVLAQMKARSPGLVEKSRDMGASWILMSLAATLCLFNRSLVVGVGSSKESKVDALGDPSSLFWKLKFFIKNLPPEFKG
jgi:phage terminase large subunit